MSRSSLCYRQIGSQSLTQITPEQLLCAGRHLERAERLHDIAVGLQLRGSEDIPFFSSFRQQSYESRSRAGIVTNRAEYVKAIHSRHVDIEINQIGKCGSDHAQGLAASSGDMAF